MFSALSPLLLAAICVAQANTSDFEKEHSRGVAQNPEGVRLVISTPGTRSSFRLSEWVTVQLTFTSEKVAAYSAELASAGNTASVSDTVVLQKEGATEIGHMGHRVGIVCCDSTRRQLKKTPSAGRSMIQFSQLLVLRNPLDPFPPPISSLPAPGPVQPGNYEIFLQTRRVLRGWPKGDRKFRSLSDSVVTSSNILHITLLPASSPGSTTSPGTSK